MYSFGVVSIASVNYKRRTRKSTNLRQERKKKEKGKNVGNVNTNIKRFQKNVFLKERGEKKPQSSGACCSFGQNWLSIIKTVTRFTNKQKRIKGKKNQKQKHPKGTLRPFTQIQVG